MQTHTSMLTSYTAAKQQEEMTFTSLRSMQHKDSDGNIISKYGPWGSKQAELISM